MEGAELVIHYSGAAGRGASRSYRGLRLANPVRIILTDYAAGDSHAHQFALWTALDTELTEHLGAEPVESSDDAGDPEPGDWAGGGRVAEDLLVLVGDDRSLPSAEATRRAGQWSATYADNSILPILPLAARTSAAALLPPGAHEANAAFWKQHPREALPALLARAGVTVGQPRVFISYRQVDSAALAVQLFDALSHAGFEVFLDHFRIPPGVNFQSRLTQELGDKSMMLVLESERLGESQWVAHEISVAKSCGLGLLALQLPGGKNQGSIDPGNRQCLSDSDFAGGRFDEKAILTDAMLEEVVSGIKLGHGRTLVARRRMLEMSFEGAMVGEKCHTVRRLGNGAFAVQGGGRRYRVWLTPRPPELPDFHRAHGALSVPEVGVVIGLSRLMEPARRERTAWLAGLCRLELVDEGQLLQAAKAIAAGTL